MDPDSIINVLIEGSVLRTLGCLRQYVVLLNDALVFLSRISECNSVLMVISLIWYEYFVYHFQPYMMPLFLLIYVMVRLIAAEEFITTVPQIQNTSNCDNQMKALNVNGETSPSPANMHPLHKLQALMELMQVVQSTLPVAKSIQLQLLRFEIAVTVFRFAELVNMKLVSWKCCNILVLVTLWLYFIGFRYLLMTAGFSAFFSVNPHFKMARTSILRSIASRKFVERWPRIQHFITKFASEASKDHVCDETEEIMDLITSSVNDTVENEIFCDTEELVAPTPMVFPEPPSNFSCTSKMDVDFGDTNSLSHSPVPALIEPQPRRRPKRAD